MVRAVKEKVALRLKPSLSPVVLSAVSISDGWRTGFSINFNVHFK